MREFNYKDNNFLLDGKPFIIRSGSIHYFRLHRDCWKDRLLKLKECGFNTVETYVAWNLIEEQEGKFDFTLQNDVGRFLDLAKELGLFAIVRPGPYICAEWEFGGFPAWLLKKPDLEIRCNNSYFVKKSQIYLSKVFEILKPRLYNNGGNVLMVQLENEYGSFGNDKKYLAKMKKFYEKSELNCLIFTSDGAAKDYIQAGEVKGALSTVNFGSNVIANMETLKKYNKKIPYMCAEFWCGWFDHWYEEHHTRDPQTVANEVENFLKNGYSFNFYMFYGGTNFGFMNGANHTGTLYQPTVTSYDYCGLLSEAGDRTEAYYKVRDLFIKYGYNVPDLTAKESEKRAYGKIKFVKSATLKDNIKYIGKKYKSTHPKYMEAFNQNYGYILYSYKFMTKEECREGLSIDGLHDRAQIFIDDKKVATLERSRTEMKIEPPFKTNGKKLDILVENMGRVNYGIKLIDRKGLSAVRTRFRTFTNWEITTLPMNNLENIKWGNAEKYSEPAFYKGEIDIEEIADTFIEPSGFKKGFIVVNGNNVGRYYNDAGPQKTLYIPAQFLKKGKNEIILFDSDGVEEIEAKLTDKPNI